MTFCRVYGKGRVKMCWPPTPQAPNNPCKFNKIKELGHFNPLKLAWIVLCTSPADVKVANGTAVRRSVLVVHSQPDELARFVAALREAGYDVSGASSFEEGRRLLSALAPLVLLTSIKLGGHNGLHLVVRARLSRPELSAIVTHHVHDTVLEAEAHRQEAKFLVQPCSTAELIGHVKSAADTAARAAAAAR